MANPFPGNICPIYVNISRDFFDYCKLDVINHLGSGMFGNVVLTKSSIISNCYVAVKMLTLDKDVDQKKRLFFSEMRAMQVCYHKHIMKATYAYHDPSRLYICMDYCPFGSLDKYITDLDFGTTELFLVQLASAVKHMHNNRIAHLDIKLPNILVRTRDQVLLADFGLSCELPRGVEAIPAKCVGGTRNYFPPETTSNGPNGKVYPMKMDMYSLGVVLKAMIFGQNPEHPVHGAARSRTADVPELLTFCLANLLKGNPTERMSSAQLMDTLLKRSQWKTFARELEIKYNSEHKAPAQIFADLISTNRHQPSIVPITAIVISPCVPQGYH